MATKGNSGNKSRSQGRSSSAKSRGKTGMNKTGVNKTGKTGKTGMSKTGIKTVGRASSRSPAHPSSTSPRGLETRSERSDSRGAENSDAFDVLKAQHREVESLFKQFERTETDNEAFEISQLICQKLTVHATIEEELLYPLARRLGQEQERGEEDTELKDMVLEAAEEHLSAKRLIADIQAVEAGDETLDAKISVLKEQISHHVDEEEDELFPGMKKEVSKEKRRSLGQQLLARTEQLEAEETVEVVDNMNEKALTASSADLDEDEGDDSSQGGDSIDAGAQEPNATSRPTRVTPHQHH